MGLFSRERKGGKVRWGISFQWHKEQQQELVGTKAEARRMLARRLAEVAAGSYSPEHKTGAVTARMFAKTWGDKRTNKTAADDRARLAKHFVPYLGDMKLEDIRPKHIIAWLERLRAEAAVGPKTIINVYGNVCTMFKRAVIDELISATPCVIPDGTLPPKPPKKPGIYEKAAIVKLLTDARVPHDRRVFYSLAFLTGMRHGEVAGRRWRDIDPDATPLQALHIRTQYNDEPLKSPDGEPRWRVAPIHPLLRAALQEWHDVGFPRLFGRMPRPEDFIVPSRHGVGEPKTVRRSLTNLVELDCPAVDVEPLTFHRTRDTFISLCRRGGAPKDVVERITHNAKGDTVDTYTHLDWLPLCAAVGVIDLGAPSVPLLPGAPGSSMSPSMSHSEVLSVSSENNAELLAGRTGLEHVPRLGKYTEDKGIAQSDSAETDHISQGFSQEGSKYVTGHAGWWGSSGPPASPGDFAFLQADLGGALR